MGATDKQFRQTSHWRTAAIMVVTGMVCFVGFVLFAFRRPSTGYRAEYPNMTFYGEQRRVFDTFTTAAFTDWEQIAHVYFKAPDDSVIYLPNAKPSDIERFSKVVDEHLENGVKRIEYESTTMEFTFRGDQLVWVAGRAGTRLGRQPTGPFFSLPIDRNKLEEAFGEPTEYGRTVSGAP